MESTTRIHTSKPEHVGRVILLVLVLVHRFLGGGRGAAVLEKLATARDYRDRDIEVLGVLWTLHTCVIETLQQSWSHEYQWTKVFDTGSLSKSFQVASLSKNR